MIETLYFFCYYAYLHGDLANTRMYYDILREEFKTARPDSLKPHQYLELKKIKEALISGNISKGKWLSEQVESGPMDLPITEMGQKELVRKIHFQGLNRLKEILQEDVCLYDIEFPCPPYGFVDMVYMGKNTIYPVEVKKDQGKHDLIGQIYKYDLFHKLRLHLKQYEFIKSLTICHSYQSFVTSELKQMEFNPLVYSCTKDAIQLSPI